MKKAAIFDLDNTLLHGSSLFALGRRLLRRNMISWPKMLQFAWYELRFVVTRTESSSASKDVLGTALSLCEGRSVEELRNVCEELVREVLLYRLNPRILAELRWHQAQGHDTWIATASAYEIAAPLAKALGVNGVSATQLQSLDGFLTGELVDGVNHGFAKAENVAAIALRRGWDLSQSYAYTDSLNDLPLLCLVGRPAVINANRAFELVAQKNGWNVMREAVEVLVQWRNVLEAPRAIRPHGEQSAITGTASGESAHERFVSFASTQHLKFI